MAYYFASDVHLGLSFRGDDPLERERRFVAWLDAIEADCEALFLVGDIFDFWFEYKRIVPKGFTRTLGKLSAMCDRGIPVHFFVGNHDLWVGTYFQQEVGMQVHLKPEIFELQGKRVFVAHGDGLGKIGDWKYKTLRSIFHSKTLRWIFSGLLHPNLMMRFGAWWSAKNRHGRDGVSHGFRGEGEPIVCFARVYVSSQDDPAQVPDYFVCGHIHTPAVYRLSDKSEVVILGEWIERPTAGVMRDGVLTLQEL